MYELMAEDGGDPDCPECEGDMLPGVTVTAKRTFAKEDFQSVLDALNAMKEARAEEPSWTPSPGTINHDNIFVELYYGIEDFIFKGVAKYAGVKLAAAPFIIKTGKVATKIPFSSTSLGKVAKSLEHGATSATVKSKSEAEELFLALYHKEGYKNTTGMTTKDMKDLYMFPEGKKGTYHWDLNDTQHGGVPHLQIHDFDGRIIRIFFPE